jgi:hypothetical protein
VDETGTNLVNFALRLLPDPAVIVHRSVLPEPELASVTIEQVIASELLTSVNVQYGSALSAVIVAAVSLGMIEKSPLATPA